MCGMLPLSLISIGLRVYGKPNLPKTRMMYLRLLIGWLGPFARKIGYCLMGISLGLHVRYPDNSQYYLGLITAVLFPIINAIVYFGISLVFRRPSLPDWYKSNRGSGMIPYTIALSTYDLKIMHLVLLSACIGYVLTDKIYYLIFGWLKIEEKESECAEDSILKWSTFQSL